MPYAEKGAGIKKLEATARDAIKELNAVSYGEKFLRLCGLGRAKFLFQGAVPLLKRENGDIYGIEVLKVEPVELSAEEKAVFAKRGMVFLGSRPEMRTFLNVPHLAAYLLMIDAASRYSSTILPRKEPIHVALFCNCDDTDELSKFNAFNLWLRTAEQ